MRSKFLCKFCEVCGSPFERSRPNTCRTCYFKERHQKNYEAKISKCSKCNKYLKCTGAGTKLCDGCKTVYRFTTLEAKTKWAIEFLEGYGYKVSKE